MDPVEKINWSGKPLAYIIRARLAPEKTTFLTPPDFELQLGFVVYPKDGEIIRHDHRPIDRHITGTSEIIVIKKGGCRVDIYNGERHCVARRELDEGDILLMVSGGHGFTMSKDTILLEIKQGPYSGADEKERF